jgi:hypothetical protein
MPSKPTLQLQSSDVVEAGLLEENCGQESHENLFSSTSDLNLPFAQLKQTAPWSEPKPDTAVAS